MINYELNAASILTRIRYITVATISKEGLPWNTPLGFRVDKALNFFWISEHTKQHSKNIRENEDVSIVIFDSTAPEERGEAVYIAAKAHEISELENIKYARRLLKGNDADALAKLSGTSARRAYQAIPQKIWINGPRDNHPDTWRDTRFELDIAKLKGILGKQDGHTTSLNK